MGAPDRVSTRGSAPAVRRPVVILALAASLFGISTLVGVLASPLVPHWAERPFLEEEDPTDLIVQWRRSVYQREADPAVAEAAPPVSLRTPAGRRVTLDELRGQEVALVFAEDGST